MRETVIPIRNERRKKKAPRLLKNYLSTRIYKKLLVITHLTPLRWWLKHTDKEKERESK